MKPELKPDLKVQRLERSDWPDLADLYSELFQTHGVFFNWSFDSAMSEFENSESLVVKNSAQIQSFLTYRVYPDRIEIMAIGTRPGSEKQGYASVLLLELLKLAAQRSITIWLEVHENNLQAVAFYVKNHFSVLNQRKNYYADGGSALIMQSKV